MLTALLLAKVKLAVSPSTGTNPVPTGAALDPGGVPLVGLWNQKLKLALLAPIGVVGVSTKPMGINPLGPGVPLPPVYCTGLDQVKLVTGTVGVVVDTGAVETNTALLPEATGKFDQPVGGTPVAVLNV